MNGVRQTLAILTLIAAAAVASTEARAQSMGHRQMSHRMVEMQRMMSSTDSVIDRASRIARDVGARSEGNTAGSNEFYSSMQQMARSMGEMAKQMKALIRHGEDAMQNNDLMAESGVQQGMQNFQAEMQAMVKHMESALQGLERMSRRVDESQPGG